MPQVTVTAVSSTAELINTIVRRLREKQAVTLQATGADAIRQLLQTVVRIRRLGLPQETPLVYASEVQSAIESQPGEPIARLSLATVPQTDDAQVADWPRIEEEIKEQFEAWETMPDGDSPLAQKLREHNAESPVLSGGDVDAAWDQAGVGEETVGGATPTPDQDVVDELGEAVGLTYDDDEPLRTGEKLAARDRHRWELDPASTEEE
jgi:stage V sporulation protein SpoVS